MKICKRKGKNTRQAQELEGWGDKTVGGSDKVIKQQYGHQCQRKEEEEVLQVLRVDIALQPMEATMPEQIDISLEQAAAFGKSTLEQAPSSNYGLQRTHSRAGEKQE